MKATTAPEKPKGFAIEVRLIAYANGKRHTDQAHYCGSLKPEEAAEIYELLNARLDAELRSLGLG